jgi:hypothetical protein
MGRVIPPEWLSPQSPQVAKVIGSWNAVTAPPNLIRAFAQMVITSHWSPEHQALTVNAHREFARKLRTPRNVEELKQRKKPMPLIVNPDFNADSEID